MTPSTSGGSAPADASLPFGHGLRRFWHLDPAIRFLNHGSFGATPLPVLQAQQEWRLRMEREPVRFMVDELPAAIRTAAAALADFVGADADHLAFTFNATEAINAVLTSIDWRPGDRLVIANHAYPAVRNAVCHIARRYRLQVTEAVIPFPLGDEDALVDAYAKVISAATRLVVVDHVFSPLAIVAPVARLIELCRAQGVAVLVDGAHAPGMLPLELGKLGADWYVGNAHKWMFAAKGCAFLHVATPARDELHPAVISNFYGTGFPAEFDWLGTHDYTAWLSLPAAIDFIGQLGVERYRVHLKQLAATAAGKICRAWSVELPAPTELLAGMATIPVPPSVVDAPGHLPDRARQMRLRLLDEFAVEVPIMVIDDRLWVRISAQVYNELVDYDALVAAIPAILDRSAISRRHKPAGRPG